MSLTELVEQIAQTQNLTKEQVRGVLEQFFSTVKAVTLGGDENVKLLGFGVFSKKVIKPRKTPQGGMSEGRTTIRFKASR